MKLDSVENIFVIGCGGTGSMLILPLVRYLFAKKYTGKIIFVDGDKYEQNNIERQNFNPEFIGTNKAEYQYRSVCSNIPSFEQSCGYIDRFLSKKDVEDIITENSIVFNCADNIAIRKYVEDKVNTLSHAAHICCGNEMHSGQVQVSYVRDGKRVTPKIYEYHPEFNSENGDRSSMNCQELSSLESGGQLVIANMMAAALAMGFLYQLTNYVAPINDSTYTEFTNTSAIRYNLLFGSYAKYDI